MSTNDGETFIACKNVIRYLDTFIFVASFLNVIIVQLITKCRESFWK